MSALVFGSPEAMAAAQRNRTVDQVLELLREYDKHDEAIADLKLDIEDIKHDAAVVMGCRLTLEERNEIAQLRDEIESHRLDKKQIVIKIEKLGWTYADAWAHEKTLKATRTTSGVTP